MSSAVKARGNDHWARCAQIFYRLQTIQILMTRAASRLGDAINKLKINAVGRKAPPRRSDQGQRPMRGRVQQSTAVATAQE